MKASNELKNLYDSIYDAYTQEVNIEGYKFKASDRVKQLVKYSNAMYVNQGNDGNVQPYFDVLAQVVDSETTATYIKRKHIEAYAVNEGYVFSSVIEAELQEEFDRLVFENFLKDFREAKSRFGVAFVVDTEDDSELGYKLEVKDVSNAVFDAMDIEQGGKLFPHFMNFMELDSKAGVWNTDSIEELKLLAEKNKEGRVQVAHIECICKESQILENGDDDYGLYEIYVGVSDGSLFYLDHNKLEKKRIYTFSREKRIGNEGGLPIGAMEEGLTEQIWINDIAISMHEAIALGSKQFVKTNKDNLPAVLNMENGTHIYLEPNEYYETTSFDMPNFDHTRYIHLYLENLRRKTGMHQAITGEEQKAGTPYAGQALQSRQASSGYNYRRERDGQDIIWIINNLILPRLVKRIQKEHTLNASYSPRMLNKIDDAVVTKKLEKYFVDNLFDVALNPELLEQKQGEFMAEQKAKGDRRSGFVPKDYITMDKIEKDIRFRITSDQDDTQGRINSMVAQMSSLAPDDPLRQIYMDEVRELSGQSPAQFGGDTPTGKMKAQKETNLQKDIETVTPEAQS